MQRTKTDRSSPTESQQQRPPHEGAAATRRGFLYNTAAAIIGFIALAIPLAAGLVTFFAPLGRRAKGNRVRVASLDDIPPDGIPRRFPVIVSRRRDAWNVYPPEAIGAVFLRRTSENAPPEAVTSVCPHLGCAVDFRGSLGYYLCPCHNSSWLPDGTRVDPASSPSPRDLDELKVEVRDGQVWVDYQKFRSGISEQVPA